MQALLAGKAQSNQSKACPRKRNRNRKPCFLPVERVSTYPTFSALQILSYALSSQLPPFLTYNEPSSAAPAGMPYAFLYCNPVSVCRAQLLSFRKGLRKEPGANYREAPSCLSFLVLVSLVGWQNDAWAATFQPQPPSTWSYQSWAAVVSPSHRTRNPLSLGRLLGSRHPDRPFCLLITSCFCTELCHRSSHLSVFTCKRPLSLGRH